MKLVVKSRDLKWAGNRLLRGSQFEVKSERERPLAELLLKLGKVEVAKRPAPVRKVATTRAALSEAEPAPEAAQGSAPPEPEKISDAEENHAEADSSAAPRGAYRTRRLKSED
jgi:hypothetical protein